MTLIGITGATGQIGQGVAQKLAEHDVKQRLLVRDRNRAPQIDQAEIVEYGGYIDTEGMTKALQGVETLFFVSGHFSDDRLRDHKSAVDAAVAAGVKTIVYLSFLNAAEDATFIAAREHYHTEQYIRDQNVNFTFLRAGLYADLVPTRFVGENATLRGPAGDGRASYVTRADIIDCAVAVLIGEGHHGKTYDITGSEALTLYEVADLVTEFSGRKCTYYDETLEEARASRASYGASDEIVDIWISSYTSIASGEMSTISDAVEKLTGHPPQTLRDYLAEHPEAYQQLLD